MVHHYTAFIKDKIYNCIEIILLFETCIDLFVFIFQGLARAKDAEYLILIDDFKTDSFNEDLQMFKGVEKVKIKTVDIYTQTCPCGHLY